MRDELKKIIDKWQKKVDMFERCQDNNLFFTAEDREMGAYYAQTLTAIIDDLKKLEALNDPEM